MSTFKGVIDEFPNIRVDYFRPRPGAQPALACFLTHVHSDHLEGLESFKSPFLYCSAATKEILLRLERKIHRVMFSSGLTETRKPQYKKLKNLLKPIPLETPTEIELSPGNEIQVTLFDANHCTGSVMFLFEGNGKAVLYTGDIRSEPWWLNNLTRSPFMIEYTTDLKTLDCIYIDTSHTGKLAFPSKADGLKELLQKVSKYPTGIVFHFAAWTFGYEQVWMALSKALNSPIHVEPYKLGLYKPLRGNAADPTSIAALAHEGPVLTGYTCANTPMPGCLTGDNTARLHSCEMSMCQSLDEKTVWIRPIVTRTRDGAEIAEIGIGGGGGDLTQRLELEFEEDGQVEQLMKILEITDDPTMTEVKEILAASLRAGSKCVSLDATGLDLEDNPTLPQILKALARSVAEKRSPPAQSLTNQSFMELPKIITFPYARHSSYDELCDLVRVFRPRDVYPCTVDEQHWDDENISICSLFGRWCSGFSFRHEDEMDRWRASRIPRPASQQTHSTTKSQSSQLVLLDSPEKPLHIAAVSPHSESQGLRRKAIHEQFEDGEVKRARLSYDGSHSSPKHSPEYTDQPSHEEAVVEDGSISSLNGDEPPQQNDSDLYDLLMPNFMDDEDREAATGRSHPEDYATGASYFDPVDGIFRCNLCGHELWGGLGGFCTGRGCVDGPEDDPYLEVLDPEAGPLPDIAVDETTDELLEGDRLKEVAGPCLDYESSAYDSQDSSRDFREEYDAEDSFIDDHENSEDEGDNQSLSEDGEPPKVEEPNYEAMYNQLRAEHNLLINDYGNLHGNFRDFKKEFLGSDYEDSSDYDEMDDMDEDGGLVVNIAVADPVVTELVLYQPQEQSQESESLELAEDGPGWHEISLPSSNGDHTHPEVEL